MNKAQLYEGKNSKGEDITPSYFEDPYFKTRESAARYSEWKDRITPNSKRKPGTPNLFINGMFYNSLRLRVDGQDIKMTTDNLGNKIIMKYTDIIFGLYSENKRFYIKDAFGVNVKLKVGDILKLNFV